MKTKRAQIALVVLAVGLGVIVSACRQSETPTAQPAKAAAKYYCPMHPSYTSDRPGDCPICGMKLVPIKSGDTNAVQSAEGAMGSTVPGRITVHIDAEKQQTIGVRTAPVERRELSRTVRTTGIVQHDERRLFKVTPRFGGFVRKLFVNYVGQSVQKGDPLFTVYSPELFATEREYLLNYQQAKKVKENGAELQQTAQRLLDAARKRLALWEISDEEMKQLEERGQANDELIFRSPVSGHVISKTAVEGKSFMAGESLYELADLSHLWLRAFVYEYELPLVKVGQKARVTFPSAAGKVWESTVTFINPHIDAETRRAELRLELDNPQHELKPDMWADVELQVSFGNVLTVPDSAVIDTGVRYVAFVEISPGHFEPREVKVGAKTDDFYEVLDGLKEGEPVVTRALFLVDSESQLKAVIAGMGSAGEHKH